MRASQLRAPRISGLPQEAMVRLRARPRWIAVNFLSCIRAPNRRTGVTDELLEAMLEAERTGHVRRKYVSPDPAQDVWELTEKGRLLAQSAEN